MSNLESSNPETPRAVLPDLYVGTSPSFSSHFLHSNIAIPPSSTTSLLSPSVDYGFDSMNPLSPGLSYLQPPSLINIRTSYTDKRSKAKKQLSAREFNDLFSGQTDSATHFRHSTTIIKRKLIYFGTVEHFDNAVFNSASMPSTPVRHELPMLENDGALTPMRYQYRLNQMRKSRPVLLRSPLRSKAPPKVSRSMLRSNCFVVSSPQILIKLHLLVVPLFRALIQTWVITQSRRFNP